MRKYVLAGAVALAALASVPASAQMPVFTPFGASPGAGFTVINTFDTMTGLSGSGYQLKTPPADNSGAPPANSSPAGTSYLSVLGGGSALYDLSALLPTGIQFDWGSIDSYNTLTVLTAGGTTYTYIPGSMSFPNDADGNQVKAGTNGLFTLSFLGDRVKSVTFASSSNSFELDNFAIQGAVPEPATWAMMIGGFGLIGGTMRRRKAKTAVAFA